MARTYFTADTHFCHLKILEYCNRPFETITEMDEALIREWNKVVNPEDTVYHLGDFAHWWDPDRVRSIFSRLNGQKHLCPGNHDPEEVYELPWASTPTQMREIVADSRRLVLFHYSMRTWPGVNKKTPSIHLYGHSHNNLPGYGDSTDVGVDAWNYKPVRLGQIIRRIADATQKTTASPEDHKNSFSP